MKKNPLIVIFITVFIDLVGFGMIIPLSPYLAQRFGADALQVGLLMASYSAFQFLFSPFWGRLSDRIGRRPVLLISLLGASLAHSLFAFADTLWVLYLARSLAGLFGANISTAMAYIADVTNEKDRSKGMGLIGAAFGLGFVLGPTLGGLLAGVSDSAPAFGASIICFANFLLATLVLPESLTNKSQVRERVSRFFTLILHLRSRDVGLLLIAGFAMNFSMANMEASLFLLMKDRFSWDMQTASFAFAYVGVMIAFTQGFLVRKLIPKFGEQKLLFIGPILFSTGMLLIGVAPSVLVMAAAMTTLALGSGLFNPSLLGTISVRSDRTRQGEVMGVSQSMAALARIFGPPAGGYFYKSVSMGAPFFFASMVGLYGFLLILASSRRS
jgi:multidrug resistance protein